MIVDNIFLRFQKSGTKSTGDFTFCTATAILHCTFYPALLKSATQIVNNHSFCFSHQTDLGEEAEGHGEGGIRDGEIGKGQIEEGGCE